MIAKSYKHRKSIRLNDHDYSQAGAYFVTICTYDRQCVLGEVIDGEIHLNDVGRIIKSEWLKTGEIRKNVIIDSFIIIPNHLHGILIIIEMDVVGAHSNVPLPDMPQTERFGKSTKNSIPTIVKLFKSTTTKQINQLRNSSGFSFWQRNYVACPERSRRKRVICNEKELNRIRDYIINNPFNWADDNENPQNWK